MNVKFYFFKIIENPILIPSREFFCSPKNKENKKRLKLERKKFSKTCCIVYNKLSTQEWKEIM